MSRIITTVEAKVYLELTEGEAKALSAICGYGPKEFKEWFYRNMGKHYLQPFEKHLDTLFVKARRLDVAVKQVEEARKSIKQIDI
jgi:hypothetical protein